MPTRTTQVVIFKASEAYQKDPSIITALFNIFFKAKGADRIAYYGQQVQDPTIGYYFLDWDSCEDHKAFMDGPTRSDVLSAFAPCTSSLETTYHVKFSGPSSTALVSPVAHVVLLSILPGAYRAAVPDFLAQQRSVALKVVGESRFVYGQSMEDPDKYVMLCGWPSDETREMSFATHSTLVDETRKKARALVAFEEVYATLKPYRK